MKLKSFLTGICAVLLTGSVYAKSNDKILSVPFYHEKLSYGQQIHAQYHFKKNQILNCQNMNGYYGHADWNYKGTKAYGTLPATLKNNRNAPGQWADPEGTITITSDDMEGVLEVDCEYKNIN